MNLVNFNIEKRDVSDKTALRKARAEGLVPGVLYGGDEVIHFTVDAQDLRPLIFTPELRVGNFDIDGQNVRCILKDVQFHPVTDEVVHVDLLQMVDGKSMSVNIPVKFSGVSPGMRAGGKLVRSMRRVKAIVTPESFVDALVVDVSHLEMGQSARVRDIENLDGVKIMTAPATPLATVMTPRAMRSAATAQKKAEVQSGATAAEEDDDAEA